MEPKTTWKGAGWYELGTAKPQRRLDPEWFDDEAVLRTRLGEIGCEGAYGVYQGDGEEPVEDWYALYSNAKPFAGFEGTYLNDDYGNIPWASGDDLRHDLELLEAREGDEVARFAEAIRWEISKRKARAEAFKRDLPWLFDDEVVSATEAAEMLGVNRARVNQLLNSGQLEGCKVGNTWQVYRYSVEARLIEKPKGGRPKK